MQGLEGGRGPPADSGRNRTRREETNDGVFDRRAGDTYNGYGYTYITARTTLNRRSGENGTHRPP